MKRSHATDDLERKFVDYEYEDDLSLSLAGSEADPNKTPIFHRSISGVTRGDGPSEREGRRVLMKSVVVHGFIEMSETSATNGIPLNGGQVRCVLILDTQTNGVQFRSEDVFLDPSNSDLDAFALRNLEWENRFEILDDQIYTITPQNNPYRSSTTGSTIKQGQLSIGFRLSADEINRKANYTSLLPSIGAITDNSIHVLVVGSPSNMSDCVVRYVSRVRYIG